jgi:Predicted metal-binding integral membrane protein (DUF2182)
MAAMMLPGAVPAVLRRAHVSGRLRTGPLFVGSYLAVWALVAVAVYALYRPHGSVAAGAVAIAAGVYELTPPKQRCRQRCRIRCLPCQASAVALPGCRRQELPAADLAAMPGAQHQNDQLTPVKGVKHPVIANPDTQYAVRACDHLRRGRSRIDSEDVDGYSPASALTCSHGTESPGSASASRAAAASARSSSRIPCATSALPPASAKP